MARPYDYDCDCGFDNTRGLKGRQGEQFFDGELHDIYEAIKHLIDYPISKNVTPEANHIGSLWLDQRTNILYMWVGKGYKHDRNRNGWLPVFSDKFQITDEILEDLPSSTPVVGQLWLYNGVLMYFDGAEWQPVKALEQSDTQFNTSLFSDFHIYAPLAKVGSTVIDDTELEADLNYYKKYLEGAIDHEHWEEFINYKKQKWRFGDSFGTKEGPESVLLDGYYQYLVPNITVDRVFVEDKFDTNYLIKNRSVIQYSKDYLFNQSLVGAYGVKVPSLIHMNPGKLCGMTKRIFKIDKTNPKIQVPATNTEFYGCKVSWKTDVHGVYLRDSDNKRIPDDENIHWHWLRPTKEVYATLAEKKQREKEKERRKTQLENLRDDLEDQGIYVSDDYDLDSGGDYEVQQNGIYLSYEAVNKYDYVLSITYNFSWMNATGILRQTDNRSGSSSFYIPNKLGATNIFVNGFDYEDTYFSFDAENKTVTLAEDVSNKNNFDVMALDSESHEYGFIREVNMRSDNEQAHFSTIHRFTKPIIFLNGEILTRSQWFYYDKRNLMEYGRNAPLEEDDRPHTSFSVKGAKPNMCWTVIETKYKDATTHEDVDMIIEDDGIVADDVDSKGNIGIRILDPDVITYKQTKGETTYVTPDIVLFVNGLMIRKEDIFYDLTTNVITTQGLKSGMEYVLLNDKWGKLYTEESNTLIPAISALGRIDEVLVYHNGYLLSNSSSFLAKAEEEAAAKSAVNGEIQVFEQGTKYLIFNGTDEVWEEDVDGTIEEAVNSISKSYTMAPTAVYMSDKVSNTPNDEIVVFGFKLSNTVEHEHVPVTVWLHDNDSGAAYIRGTGYSETDQVHYSRLLAGDDSSASLIHYDVLDPTNPTIYSGYTARNNAYFDFKINAFNKWTDGRGTLATQIANYLAAGRSLATSTPTTYPCFYKGERENVWMTSEEEFQQYLELYSAAKGVLLARKIFIGVDYKDSYYTMVWLNGVRQYPGRNYTIVGDDEYGYFIQLEGVDEEGWIDTEYGKFPCTGYLTYIIERPEGVTPPASYMILDNKHAVEGSYNVYSTKDPDTQIDPVTRLRDTSNDISMFPGRVTLYIDGVRQPKDAYTLMDNYTIRINDKNVQLIGANKQQVWNTETKTWDITCNNFPTQTNLNNSTKDAYPTIRHIEPDRILLEIRHDTSWNERELILDNTFDGDIQTVMNDRNGLPISVLESPDLIYMFVDGLFYGLTKNDGYRVNLNAGTISILDGTVLGVMKYNDIENYLLSHPELEVQRADELAVYRARELSRIHTLIVEWR